MTLREKVYAKYGGKCAYTGKPLESDWQIDHIVPKYKAMFLEWDKKKLNSIENLIPTFKIINHYKRTKSLEGFRKFIADLQRRINELPKRTTREATIKRAAYIKRVAELFGITPETPFSGKFYFETLEATNDIP
jgi:hypothetical protein